MSKKLEDFDEEPRMVTCPECGNEQLDMGQRVRCETCDHSPMPWYDNDGILHE